MNNSNERPLDWTTLEESKQLVEAGLSVETADMSYTWDFDDSRYIITTTPAKNWIVPKYAESTKIKQVLPCWSLGALIQLLPRTIEQDYDLLINLELWVMYRQPLSKEVRLICSSGVSIIENVRDAIIWLLKNKIL